MTAPVLEWRAADAAKKLLQASLSLGQAIPEGDGLNADNTRKWSYATATGALIVTDLEPGSPAELIMRLEGIVTGTIAAACDDTTPVEQRRAFGMWLVTQGLALAKAP